MYLVSFFKFQKEKELECVVGVGSIVSTLENFQGLLKTEGIVNLKKNPLEQHVLTKGF
jgi:hypothetical protein